LVTQPRTVSVGSIAEAALSDTYQKLNLFGEVFERVRADYVEKPDDSKLVEFAINGMLAGLDPHSSYMDPSSLRDIQVQTRGEFGGLGIEARTAEGRERAQVRHVFRRTRRPRCRIPSRSETWQVVGPRPAVTRSAL
jgi:C-terminal processing protease CtpA/Prc